MCSKALATKKGSNANNTAKWKDAMETTLGSTALPAEMGNSFSKALLEVGSNARGALLMEGRAMFVDNYEKGGRMNSEALLRRAFLMKKENNASRALSKERVHC